MKVWFTENIEMPTGAVMLCTIDRETFHILPRTRGSEILAHPVILPTTIPVSLILL